MIIKKSISNFFSSRYVHAFFGIFLAIILYIYVPSNPYPQAPAVAAMVGLMAVWWIFEVIPIPVTSLFPLFLLPAFNIHSVAEVGAFYGRPIIFLFLGGFILALGLQESGLHKRIALKIISFIGSKPSKIILGFMVSSAVLSMWISNTASVIVMLPIGLSILETAKEQGVDKVVFAKFSICLMLAMAYAADIGGMSTPIGTPPNLVFLEMFSQLFPKAPDISFLEWMVMGIPLTILFLFFGWLLLTKVIFPLPSKSLFEGSTIIQKKLELLGKIRRDEIIAGSAFLLAVILWISGSDLSIGPELTIRGWRSLTGLGLLNDAAVAVMCATLLFIVPSKKRNGKALLSWDKARELPWGILLLFGGGFAIAGSFESSGLSHIVGQGIAGTKVDSPFLLVLSINTVLTFLTEITSNTAMTNLILPILAEASVSLQIDPRILMIPATLSASCAFMMPVASPTQAIVFGSGYVNIRSMIRAGIWFNVLGIILVTVLFMTLGVQVLDLQVHGLPSWAE